MNHYNFKPFSSDTSLEMMKIKHTVLKKMSLEEKAKITFDMCDSIRDISKSGIKNRHPDYTEKQVQLAVTKLIIGEKLFMEAYPGVEIKL